MASTISVANSGAFSQLISKDYKKVFFDEYKRYPEMYKAVANISTMNSAYDREGEMVGFGALQKIAEGQSIPTDNLIQGNSKVITPEDFALQFQVSANLWNDDQKGHVKKAFQELSKAAAYTRELKFWDLLNSAFVTTTRSGIDGKALVADDHPLNGFGTFSNEAATGGSLTMTSLQAARLTFQKMVNARNVPIPMDPALLIVPPELESQAEKLVKSKYNPENANEQYNPFEGLKYMVVPYLTSTTAWYLLGKKEDHDLRYIIRQPLALESTDDFDTRTSKFRAVTRFTTDFVHWRGVYANAGA